MNQIFKQLLYVVVFAAFCCYDVDVRGEEALEVVPKSVMLPEARIGEVIGNSRQDNGHQYQLTEFVRVQGEEPHPERHRVDPVFFTPVLSPPFYLLPPPEDITSSTDNSQTVDGGDMAVVVSSEGNIVSELDSVGGGSWRLKKRTNRGAHGEVWRGTRINSASSPRNPTPNADEHTSSHDRGEDTSVVYVLKRMLLEKGDKVRLAANREKFFGEMMWDVKFEGHVARYVESFTNIGVSGEELWLVFIDEGVSLHEWLYTPVDFPGGSILLPSESWQRMRSSQHAKAQIQELMRQMFASAVTLHSSGITHRDIKTSNVVWRLRSRDDKSMESSLFVVLIDFSSAYSQEVLDRGMFGDEGPCQDEETKDAYPPERIFAESSSALTPRPSFDAWSIGVLMLELLLGTQSVFTVDQRTRAMLTWKMRGQTPEDVEKALYRSALADFCILEPPVLNDKGSRCANPIQGKPVADSKLSNEYSDHIEYSYDFDVNDFDVNVDHDDGCVVTEQCGLTELAEALQRRDPLELGYMKMLGYEGLDLLSKLLKWNPEDRLTAQEALDHPFLQRDLADRTSSRGLSLGALISSFASSAVAASTMPKSGQELETGHSLQQEQLCLTPPDYPSIGEESCLAPLESEPQQFVLTDKFDVGPYRCPKCGRVFDVYGSCLRHASARGHALWCEPMNDFNNPLSVGPSPLTTLEPLNSLKRGEPTLPSSDVPRRRLPRCLSSHSLLPQDKLSGWCDVQGRRAYLEDHGAVVYASDYIIWSVFDGHVKASAAQFAAHYLPASLARHVSLNDPTRQEVRMAFLETDKALLAEQLLQYQKSHEKSLVPFPRSQPSPSITSPSNEHAEKDTTASSDTWAKHRLRKLGSAYAWLRKYILNKNVKNNDAPSSLDSMNSEDVSSIGRTAGTTATVAMITKSGQLVIANVGDSRAVLCCDHGNAVPVSRDHTASDTEESERVVELGAKIVWGHEEEVDERSHKPSTGHGGLARVNGEVAVTRSLGDASLKKFLTAEPHIAILNLVKKSDRVKYDTAQKENGAQEDRTRSSPPFLNNSVLWNLTWNDSTPVSSKHQTKPSVEDEAVQPKKRPSSVILTDLEFLVVATDGLWDVMSSQEVVDYVKARRRGHRQYTARKYETVEQPPHHRSSSGRTSSFNSSKIGVGGRMTWQEVATALTHEALLRGSMDNVGVCVIDIKNRVPWFSSPSIS